ncbi:PTS sugar transporter subunit IIC [Corynebacterium kroppenstedtii]|uniref:PTS sugar transporter subunit IIC n=1 Tax=Corynebacterium sp. PCR 32 TaxID=3351342 RepID=UPI0030A4F44E
MNVLNGISIAVVVALVPQALLGELFKALLPVFPQGKEILGMVTVASSMLPIAIGLLVAMQFALTHIQTATVAIASVMGSGVVTGITADGIIHIKGTGLVINTGLTAACAVLLILVIGDKLKSYTILVVPPTVIVLAGGVGKCVTYPAVLIATKWLGSLVGGAADLQPIVMGVVLSVIFGVMMASPISTVGIATAIFLSGTASGVANVGCCAVAFTLMWAGWRVNGPGGSLVHVIGSAKVQVANMLRRPVALLPVVVSCAISGVVAGIFRVQGTPISAGFGVSGLVGPLAALNADGWGWSVGNVAIIAVVYIVVPCLSGYLAVKLFDKKLGLTNESMYALNID